MTEMLRIRGACIKWYSLHDEFKKNSYKVELDVFLSRFGSGSFKMITSCDVIAIRSLGLSSSCLICAHANIRLQLQSDGVVINITKCVGLPETGQVRLLG
jgi:hypothetical protein